MSQTPYPYIQTLHDFDNGMGDYSIQPVATDDVAAIAEENPILAFGPLSRINIFIGATNAGKSRFLRMMAKREDYRFYDSDEAHRAIADIFACCKWLIASKDSVEFKITDGGYMLSDGSPPVLQYMPFWVKEALKGVRAQRNYSVDFNAIFFGEMLAFFENFVAGQIRNPLSQRPETKVDAESLQMALWARNLIQGEIDAQKRDEEENLRTQIYVDQKLESFKERGRDYDVRKCLLREPLRVPRCLRRG